MKYAEPVCESHNNTYINKREAHSCFIHYHPAVETETLVYEQMDKLQSVSQWGLKKLFRHKLSICYVQMRNLI